MARSSQTDMAVLGALSIEPMTGYALREAIRDVLGHFWSESFGQIYPTLARLEQFGHVERDPATRAYRITAAGTRHFHELLAQPIQDVPARNGLLLRLFFGRSLGIEACRALLTRSRDEARRRLAEYDEIAATVATESQHTDDAVFWQMTVSAGRHSARAAVAWADECLAVLDRFPAAAPGTDR
ncbi:helix-turn-helix transcriptional regulator [Polymorphospora sp. NPDC050346]|uniref:PadR family transcriptional regulator n=1 Tax=Polymorphospora sp. NPDC050346 TaxID=3155780 RepID=UPI0033E95804